MFLNYLCLIIPITMYQTLLILHSINRWLVIISLIYGIFLAAGGLRSNRIFSASDNRIRHLTATISHVQLLIGISLYMISPIVKFRMADAVSTEIFSEHTFYRFVHIGLMAVSVILITIGSAKAKRTETNRLKFRTMLIWFSIALLIILIAIPWPFSPLASRPFFRSF